MRIRVDVPIDQLRRERVEHATFGKLDAIRSALEVPAGDPQRAEDAVFDQLSVIRHLDRSDAVLRPRRRWVPAIAIAAPLAAVAVLAIVLTRGPGEPTARQPLITQHGGPSQWTSADAGVQAFADTSVEERIDDGGVTLTLARGKVECEVEPRVGRAPFRVLAGDITVTVIGTHFTVARTPAGVRVEVARGKVSVRRGDDEKFLLPGDSWSSEPVITATAPTPPRITPEPEPEIEVAPEPARPAKPALTAKEAFDQASKIMKTNANEAARLYRIAANSRDATYAGLALYGLAELEGRRGNALAALAAIDRYLAAYPRGINVEDLLWLRVEMYSMRKPIAPMKRAAEDYLKRFPKGTYAKPIRDILANLADVVRQADQPD